MLRFGLRTVSRATAMRSFIRVPFVLLLVVAAFSWRSVFRRGVTLAPLVDEDASLLDAEDASLLDAEALNATLYNLTDAEAGGVELQQEVLDLMCGRLESAYAAGGRSRIISIWRSMRYAGSRPGLLARLRFPARAEHPDRVRLFQEFRWRLSDWFLDSRGLQPEVMSELIERIKRPIDRHYGHPHTGRPYATCAVVSNSGVLLKSAHGRLIDGHDLVIRLHNARTVGYQQHVGSKATVSFINSSILHSCAVRLGCYCNPYGHFAPIVVYICRPAHFLDYLICNSTHKSPLLVTDGGFDTLCTRVVKYYSLKRFVEDTGKHPMLWGKFHDEKLFHYSSGMQAVMLALGICKRVNVFGFGRSVDANHHNHTNQTAELNVHDHAAEHDFYRDLVERPQAIPYLRVTKIEVPPVVFYH
ncbi:sialyltransferase family domain containing protein [Musa troglodytarum]|uniref:Sialyltransferase family domain containing protein n=2 Tax=Musa troglodytarum TaxID=320322 RepID=A0A9E7I077_9LILI|nr:sialyltransferase family domain containing protein [Musa troglodytarum]